MHLSLFVLETGQPSCNRIVLARFNCADLTCVDASVQGNIWEQTSLANLQSDRPLPKVTESRMGQAGMDPCGSLVPPPCSSRAIPKHTAQDCVQMVLKYLQWGRVHTLSGQSVQCILTHTVKIIVLPSTPFCYYFLHLQILHPKAEDHCVLVISSEGTFQKPPLPQQTQIHFSNILVRIQFFLLTKGQQLCNMFLKWEHLQESIGFLVVLSSVLQELEIYLKKLHISPFKPFWQPLPGNTIDLPSSYHTKLSQIPDRPLSSPSLYWESHKTHSCHKLRFWIRMCIII